MKAAKLPFIIFGLGAAVGFSACNASSESESQASISQAASSTLVKSFSLRPNIKIMQNLDSVFFSIDQVKGEIFNADSLPWGTDVRKLAVEYTLGATGSVEIIMPSLSSGQDTVINLVNNPTDSINFSGGRVWMRVTSSNSEYERIYDLKVNVHKMNADSLQWSTDVKSLPGYLAYPTDAGATEFGGKYYVMTQNASDLRLSVTNNPGSASWQIVSTSGLPYNVKSSSLCASTSGLYVMSEDGKLFESTDAATWSEVDNGWSHIYGGYAGDVIGVKGNQWVAYPSGKGGQLSAGMPVEGTSQMWTFSNDWELEPQAMIVGGKKADGTLSGQAWGFDGNRWMQLSDQMGARTLPAASGITLFPYFTYKTGETSMFIVTRQSAWIAMGGKLANGNIQQKVYYSLDNGINWLEAPESMQLPSGVAARAGASVILCDKTFSTSRAIRPITEWDAPYIYMVGGRNASGQFYNQIRTGVLNRLTFKPLQ